MRLLDTSTARFRHIDTPSQACYAILSHVWDHTDGEQSLQVRMPIPLPFLHTSAHDYPSPSPYCPLGHS